MSVPPSILKPSWRKIITDLFGNRARTLLVVASIAIGVFAVGMIAGAYEIIPGDMNASYASANPANIQITTGPLDDDFLNTLRRVDGIQAVEGQRRVTVRMNTSTEGWTNLDLIARADFALGRVESQRAVAGAQQPGEQQMVIEKRAAEKYHIQPGDRLEIELADRTRRTIEVIGISQDLTSGIGGMFNNTKGYILKDSLEWLREEDYLNTLLITVSERPNDKAYIQAVADEVTDRLEDNGLEVYQIDQAERNRHPMESILQALMRILLVLGILIVFLSGSLISNTLSALINQHLQQIGIMKLVGARRRQIIELYLALILGFGLISLVIALPLGAWAAYALSAFAAGLINFPLRGFRVIPQAILIQIVIALLIPLLAGILPVLNGVRVTVKQAFTSTGMGEGGAGDRIDRWLNTLRGLSRPMLVSIRNTFRRKSRLALTLLTLTLGGAIFISVFNVQVSLNHKINQITKYFGADVNLDFKRPYRVSQVTDIITQVPGVAGVEPWAITQGDILRADDSVIANLTLMAPPLDSRLVAPVMQSGRWIGPGDGAALTVNEAFLRRYPELHVGSTLYLNVGGRKGDWKIVGVFQFTGVDELIAYTSYDQLSQALGQANRTATFRVISRDQSLEGQKRLAQALDNTFRDRKFEISNVEAGGEFTASTIEYISILTAFLVIMALLTAAVGSIGMAGTLSMNVMERTREIGVLRAIGAEDRLILKLVLVEGLLIGMISFGLGTILSFPITAVMSELISQAIFNSPGSFVFTLQGFGIWLGVVLALSALASLAPARSAARMTIREVLAYE